MCFVLVLRFKAKLLGLQTLILYDIFFTFQVNQKMMKSALIKDLYFEIDRLKQGS